MRLEPEVRNEERKMVSECEVLRSEKWAASNSCDVRWDSRLFSVGCTNVEYKTIKKKKYE